MPSSRGRSAAHRELHAEVRRPASSGTPSAAHSQRAAAAAIDERAGERSAIQTRPYSPVRRRPPSPARGAAAQARPEQHEQAPVGLSRAAVKPAAARPAPSRAARRTPAGCRPGARTRARRAGPLAQLPEVTMCGSPNISPTTSRPPGFRTRASSRSARSWSGISPSTVTSKAASKLSSAYGSACASPSVGLDVRDAPLVRLPHHVIEHLLLDVEDRRPGRRRAARPPSNV